MSEPRRRAFVEVAVAPGATVALDPEESHHLARVLRVRPGETIAVFDGLGGEWAAEVRGVGRDRVEVEIGMALAGAPEAPVRVALVQALVRPERIEWVVQKGTEVGVAAFHLVPAERSDAPPPSEGRLLRYRRVALEATKQSGRRVVPSILVGAWPDPEPDAAFVLDAREGVAPLGAALDRRHPRAAIAVGPEGGFTDAEVAARVSDGWIAASLGPRTLRTETAGVVASAILLHLWGDLGDASGRTR